MESIAMDLLLFVSFLFVVAQIIRIQFINASRTKFVSISDNKEMGLSFKGTKGYKLNVVLEKYGNWEPQGYCRIRFTLAHLDSFFTFTEVCGDIYFRSDNMEIVHISPNVHMLPADSEMILSLGSTYEVYYSQNRPEGSIYITKTKEK